MKKKRIVSFLCSLALIVALCTPFAGAVQSDLVDAMSVDAQAALLVDLDTGLVMYEQNAYGKVYPASITKVMTALLVMEALDAGTLSLDQVITADSSAWTGIDWTSQNLNIQAGESMTVEDLLYCLLVYSANEAANILAVAVSGSVSAFVDLMNQRSEELGCTGSHYVNAHGMPDDDHYTTAYDVYLVAKEAMTYPLFRTIVSTVDYVVSPTNLTESERHIYNTNALLTNHNYIGYVYENAIGIKTGTAGDAGYCLLSAAEKEGQTLICVMMGCENPVDSNGDVKRLQFSESKRLLEWGFDNFSVHTILDATDPVAEVAVTMSAESDYVAVVTDGTLEAQLPNDVTDDAFERVISLPESVEAPVTKGQVLGTLTLTADGETYGSVNLVAVNDVERSKLLDLKQKVENFVTSWKFILIVVLIVAFILFLIIRAKVAARRRRNYHGRYRGRKASRRKKR